MIIKRKYLCNFIVKEIDMPKLFEIIYNDTTYGYARNYIALERCAPKERIVDILLDFVYDNNILAKLLNDLRDKNKNKYDLYFSDEIEVEIKFDGLTDDRNA